MPALRSLRQALSVCVRERESVRLRGCENSTRMRAMRACMRECVEYSVLSSRRRQQMHQMPFVRSYKQASKQAAAAVYKYKSLAAASVCFCFARRCHAMFGHALYAIHIMKHRYLLATVALYCTRCAVASSWQVQQQGERRGESGGGGGGGDEFNAIETSLSLKERHMRQRNKSCT